MGDRPGILRAVVLLFVATPTAFMCPQVFFTPNCDNPPQYELHRLPHPATGSPHYVAHDRIGLKLYQIHEASPSLPESPRSWFIGNNVVQDGSVKILVPVDPIFYLLYILSLCQPLDAAGPFLSWDHWLSMATENGSLSTEHSKAIASIFSLSTDPSDPRNQWILTRLEHLCQPGAAQTWRPDRARILSWIRSLPLSTDSQAFLADLLPLSIRQES